MTELSKQQSEKADYLLKIVCNSDSALRSEIAYDLFDSRDDAIYVCSILKKLSLINVIAATENDPFYLFSFNENTCHFLKQGGFIQKHKINETKQTIQPIAREKRQKTIISLIEKFWWQILIPISIGILLILIDRGVIKIGFLY